MRFPLALVLCSLLAVSATTTVASPNGVPRLRPRDARVTAVVEAGLARSATFRALVERLEQSDVIVYLAVNPILKSSLSGSLTWMSKSGGYRYLRASVDTDLSFDQMIAAVAHELQHAVEVAEDPHVSDERSLVALYRRIGSQSHAAIPHGWETVAAQQTGFRVRRELIAAPAAALRGTVSQL